MKLKEIITSKYFTIASLVLAGGLLVFASVGGTQAALTYYSENYTSRVTMFDIGVSLVENGTAVSYRDYKQNSDYVWNEQTGALLADMLASGEKLQIGKAYPEVLSIKNSGTNTEESVNTYNRVTIYKYWTDKDGNKLTSLDPSAIDLNLVNLYSDSNPDGCWILDEDATTSERIVLYYRNLLKAGESSPAFSDSITIDNAIKAKVTQTVGTKTDKATGQVYKTLTTTYDYDGTTFILEAEVDAIQEHNADAAALSVWSRNVTIDSDGNLELK